MLWLFPQYCFSRSDSRPVASKSTIQIRQFASRSPQALLAQAVDPSPNTTPSDNATILPTKSKKDSLESSLDDDGRNNMKYKFELYLRALYLLVLFLPLLLLAPVAYLSASFREKIWFPILKMTIAHSGAVSVIMFF